MRNMMNNTKRNTMKKLAAILTIAVLMLGMCACGKTGETGKDTVTQESAVQTETRLICDTCGADITDIGEEEHDKASGTTKVNAGTDENPRWVEVTKCTGSHTEP